MTPADALRNAHALLRVLPERGANESLPPRQCERARDIANDIVIALEAAGIEAPAEDRKKAKKKLKGGV